MKKYKLKLKNPNKTFVFAGVVSHSGENSEFHYLSNDVEGYDYRKSDSDKTIFTKEEIAILPYGLVKLHYIIEVKEQLYYIRIPHVKNQYVTYSEMDKCSYAFHSKNNDYTSKNKFTLEEANKSRANLEKLLDQQQQLTLVSNKKIELLRLELEEKESEKQIDEVINKEEIKKDEKKKWWQFFR